MINKILYAISLCKITQCLHSKNIIFSEKHVKNHYCYGLPVIFATHPPPGAKSIFIRSPFLTSLTSFL